MENNTAASRTISQIAADMDRIAKRRADVNRLSGSKLRAFKLLEMELFTVQAKGDPESSYARMANNLRTELGLA